MGVLSGFGAAIAYIYGGEIRSIKRARFKNGLFFHPDFIDLIFRFDVKRGYQSDHF